MTRDRRLCRLLAAGTVLLSAACSGSSGRPASAPGGSPSPPEAAPSATLSPGSTKEPGVKAGPVERIAETDELGYVVRAAGEPLEVAVDRVDMLTGDEAKASAAAHGDQLDTDYYLVNDSNRLRRYPVAADVAVWASIRMNGKSPEHERATLQEWLDFVRTDLGRRTLFHFDVEAGRVVGIEEQYLP